MTRVREESIKHGAKKGITIGLIATGGVITSGRYRACRNLCSPCGYSNPIPCTVGIYRCLYVLDTIIVRSLLVPALGHDIGAKIWWFSKED